jgi:hypothetical protein
LSPGPWSEADRQADSARRNGATRGSEPEFVPRPPSELDIARGGPEGFDAHPSPPLPGTTVGARIALEAVLRRCLARPPCVIAFSGGRDSSALLALAVKVARRDGLPLPTPVTLRFAGAERSQEVEWQQMMIDHLGLSEWVTEELQDDADLLGPVATNNLRRYGVAYSPTSYLDHWLLRHAKGGTLITGEGGDEVLDHGHRIYPLSRLVRRLRAGRKVGRGDIDFALEPLPGRWRRSFEIYGVPRIRAQLPWLTAEAMNMHLRQARACHAVSSLDARRSTLAVFRRRVWTVPAQNRHHIARHSDVSLVHPFAEPPVVASLAREAGPLGFSSRSHSLGMLFGDLLPERVVHRPDKAVFNEAVVGRYTQAFLATWDGAGVPRHLVDIDRLRTALHATNLSGNSFLLLQTAWLRTDAGHAQASEGNYRE